MAAFFIIKMYSTNIQQYLHTHSVEELHVKGVLFDMDGVLFDSMKNHSLAWHKAMRIHGMNLSREEAYLHEGRTAGGTIQIVSQRERGIEATQEEIEAIYQTKSEIFNTLPKAEPMPGAWELLQQIKASGLQIGLVTGSGQRSLLDNLSKHYPDIFTQERMVTAFDVQRGKPDPEPYLMGLEKLRLSAHEAIVIENAPLGVQSAVRAGIFTIAVNTGPLAPEVLLNEGASLLFPSMQALSDAWAELFLALK